MSAARLALGAVLLLAGAFFLRAGCRPASPPPAPFETFDVVDPERRALEAELALPEASAAPDDAEEARGLVTLVAGAPPELAAAARADVRALESDVSAVLATRALSAGAPPAERAAAVSLLGALDTFRATLHLAALAEHREGWLRAHALWRLAEGSHDLVVPLLAERLGVESHAECRVWIAVGLARHSNFSGVGDLAELADGRGELAALAADELAGVLARVPDVRDARDLAARWWRWDGGPAPWPTPERSARYRLEVWRRIAALRGDDLAARRAEDGLARLGPEAAVLLARALHDRDADVRRKAARALARMGPRGSLAGPELVAALGDPDAAPGAAVAIGLVGHPEGERALRRAAGADRTAELRLAAVRGLGRLGLPASVPFLEQRLAPGEPRDVRGAAAASLVSCGAGGRALGVLCELLTSEGDGTPPADALGAVSAEQALRAYLGERARAGSRAAEELLARWDALPAAERAALVRERAAELTR